MKKLLVLNCILILPLALFSQTGGFDNQKSINSKDADATPVITADGTIIFFNSCKEGKRSWKTENYSDTDRFDFDIYYAEKVKNGWSKAINIGRSINSRNDDAVVSISPDGQVIYYLSFKPGWERDGGPFYKAELRGTSWKNIKGLGGGITRFLAYKEKKAQALGASISPDGKEFYFATNIDSMHGMSDIWVSKFQDGTWSFPDNLGETINAKDEYNGRPYLAFDGKTLFFSSTGHGGFGGKDLYMSIKRFNKWTKPLNLGPDINSEYSEESLSIPASGNSVYLVSDRKDTKGSSDIWKAELPVEVRPSTVTLVKGIIFDVTTNEPLESNIIIQDLSSADELYSVWSNSATGQYSIVLQSGRKYGVVIDKEAYFFFEDNFDILMSTAHNQFEKNYGLHPIQVGQVIVMNNIFFDFDEANLKSESQPTLDRTHELLNKYPKMILEVRGHTDNRGTADYNLKLSQDRALAVKNALVNIGIVSSRLKQVGFGYTQPKADNTTEEGRKLNRRTEFKILAK
jgi:outer membrane protein OmpA-like peptidoglycan-associated protein